MNELWVQHAGKLIAGLGTGFGVTLTIVFRSVLLDSWNDYRARKRSAEANVLALQVKAAAAAASSANGNGALGATAVHDLVTVLTKDIEYNRIAEEKKWELLKNFADDIKGLAQDIKALTQGLLDMQKQTSQNTTLLQVVAARK